MWLIRLKSGGETPFSFHLFLLPKGAKITVLLIFVLISPEPSFLGSGGGDTEFRGGSGSSSARKSLPSPISTLTLEKPYGDRAHANPHGHIRTHFHFPTATAAEPQPPQPPFIEPATLNTSVYLGQTASLPCVVKHLGDKTVSWIRGRDLHILTSGPQVYTNDRRVVLTHHDGQIRHLWTLNIKEIQRSDEGVYECQLNTEPKLTSIHYLHVLAEPLNDDALAHQANRHSPLASLDSSVHPTKHQGNTVRILGPSLVRHKRGDTVTFTCLASRSMGGETTSMRTTNVTWFLNDIPIERSSLTRGRFRIETEFYTYSIMSKLSLLGVHGRDQGKYSCSGGMYTYPASVTLIVHDDSKYENLQEYNRGNDLHVEGVASSSSSVFRSPAKLHIIGSIMNFSTTLIATFLITTTMCADVDAQRKTSI